MLERANREAYSIVAGRAAQLAAGADLKDLESLEKQMQAIRELETARKEIFTKLGVTDVELSLAVGSIQGAKPHRNTDATRLINPPTGKAYTIEEMRSLEAEQLRELPIGDVLKVFRLIEGINQRNLARKISTSTNMGVHSAATVISRTESGTSIPMIQTTKHIISGFGWDEQDWRAQLLLEKSRIYRNSPGYIRKVSSSRIATLRA